MRIIGGKWRSRRLTLPRTSRTRPMPDRIRESVFDILASRFDLPGELPPFDVADLFAGSGGMGLEALSRGARRCDFVERSPSAIQTLRANVRGLSAQTTCRIHPADAWTMPLTTPRRAEGYGLIFVDPPYQDSGDAARGGKVPTLLSDLYRASWADERTLVVIHHPRRVAYDPNDDSQWRVWDHRVYGTAGITFVIRRGDPHAKEQQEARCSQRIPKRNLCQPE